MRPFSTLRTFLCAGLVILPLVGGLTTRPARAKVRVCVSFRGPALKNQAGYLRLLVSEMAHHPTHQVVRRGCATTMRLEYIQLDGDGTLTGQLHGSVPHRVRVARRADLPAKIREVVAFLLKREPVYLVENLGSSGLLAPPRLSLLRHGVYLFGVELAELLWWTDRGQSALPSVALRFRRTVDRWFLGAQAGFAYNPQPRPAFPEAHFLRYHGTARVEAGVIFFPKSATSLYLSGLVGVEYLQVYGLVDGQRRDVVLALFGLSARVGVELFRLYTFRLDFFAQVNLPFHKARNIDLPVIDAYTPSIQLGVGVSF